jgi:hypothetical protein
MSRATFDVGKDGLAEHFHDKDQEDEGNDEDDGDWVVHYVTFGYVKGIIFANTRPHAICIVINFTGNGCNKM